MKKNWRKAGTKPAECNEPCHICGLNLGHDFVPDAAGKLYHIGCFHSLHSRALSDLASLWSETDEEEEEPGSPGNA